MDEPLPLRRLIGHVPRRLWRALVWALAIVYFVAAAAILGLRYIVLPYIENYREDIAQMMSRSIGLKVTIGSIDARWSGLRPTLALHQLQVHDAAGRPALAFDNVDTELSWRTLLHGQLRLHRLEINAPTLAIRREADGRIFVAGIQLSTDEEGGDFSNWLLAQGSIVIRDATIQWQDAQRGAPLLELKRLNFLLENSGARHRFGLTAEPPREMATPVDVRGDFRGRNLDNLHDWRGEAYISLDHADLAVWRAWVDYPLELPQGSGGLRLWLDVDEGRLQAATADLALREVHLRLRPELPMLELAQLSGRLALRLPPAGVDASARKLTLDTREGLHLEPTDLFVRYAPTQGRKPARGEVTANSLDLDALSRLAAHLPLPEATRKSLADYAPRGRVNDLRLSWSVEEGGEDAVLKGYSVRARFENLGMRPVGAVPGFAGMSGNIEASEKLGSLNLNSRNAKVELPKVMHDPQLGFDQLTAQASWSVEQGVADVQLQNLAFNNKDAAGSASGRYRGRAGEPGEIDFMARLTRAETNAVWRYLPLVVYPETRDWLRAAIVGGKAEEARLKLKGDLKKFPFPDNRDGIFQVTTRANGATLRYAPDWPEITGISADLLFEASRMVITAKTGHIYGAALEGARAEIPDLAADEPVLKVKGKASGPTAEFLRFVDTSPVGEWIERFTEGLQVHGSGSAQIQLTIPLSHIDKSVVDGEYAFVNNRIVIDEATPPLTEVNGQLRFTEKAVTVRNASASMFGAPVTINVVTRPEGGIAITAQGGASIAALRRQYDVGLLEHMSGDTTWRGTLLVRGKSAGLTIESNLQGIASSLPEPLNKSAAEQLPLRIEKLPAPEAALPRQGESRDMLRFSLGRTLAGQLVRRHQGQKTSIERGALGLPDAPPLPERGVVLTAKLPRFNYDHWRRVLRSDGSGAELPVTALNVHADELTAFGRQFTDLSVKATQHDDTWQAQVGGKEVAGEVLWRSQGAGRLQARLKQFSLVDARAGDSTAVDEPLRELPGLDVTVDNFVLRGKALGRLELLATNRANTWQIEKLSLGSPDGTLTGDGQWRPSPSAPDTQLNFKLETANVGKLLDRLGYADAVRRGRARLEGSVSWKGPPISIDYPSLSGTMSLSAGQGQFAKLEPGVGRLLGILSLQSLPRRISLDFRDVFSEGFAFDTIAGEVKVTRGVMATENLQIQGPSAKIRMSGDVDIAGETQNLRVRVQPTLSETAAVGVALANPVAGLATLVAQKVLRDPLEQIFSYEYAVTGGWADPKVEKVHATATTKKEEGTN